MQKRSNGSKTQRRKNRKSSQGTFTPRQQAKSGSATAAKPHTIFRPDLLNYNPTEKSGYLFYKINGYGNFKDTVVDKIKIAKMWLSCLKNHPKYRDIQIDAESNIHDALNLLHKETDRIFKEYNWILSVGERKDPKLYYFKSFGDVGQHNLPLIWFAHSTNMNFRKLGLWIVTQLSKKFGIDMIKNSTFEAVIECNFSNDGEYLLDRMGEFFIDDSDPGQHGVNKLKTLQAAVDYFSYEYGEPKNVEEELKKFSIDEKEFYSMALTLADESEALYQWIIDAKKLIDGPGCDIDAYHFNPQDAESMDGEPVTIHHAIFFPWSFTDAVFSHYEDWVNDFANNCGTNDMFKYGVLTEDNHDLPVDEKPVINLIKWLDQGRELYFKSKSPIIEPYYYGS